MSTIVALLRGRIAYYGKRDDAAPFVTQQQPHGLNLVTAPGDLLLDTLSRAQSKGDVDRQIRLFRESENALRLVMEIAAARKNRASAMGWIGAMETKKLADVRTPPPTIANPIFDVAGVAMWRRILVHSRTYPTRRMLPFVGVGVLLGLIYFGVARHSVILLTMGTLCVPFFATILSQSLLQGYLVQPTESVVPRREYASNQLNRAAVSKNHRNVLS